MLIIHTGGVHTSKCCYAVNLRYVNYTYWWWCAYSKKFVMLSTYVMLINFENDLTSTKLFTKIFILDYKFYYYYIKENLFHGFSYDVSLHLFHNNLFLWFLKQILVK